MKIEKATVGNDEDGALFQCDVIEWEGALWLVPAWLENPDEGWMTPSRIIQIDGLKFQRTPGGPFGDYIINEPVPKSVLEGRPNESGKEIVVIERPDIHVPTGRA